MADVLNLFKEVKARKIIAIGAVASIICVSIGILIGYFSGRQSLGENSNESVVDAIRSSCPVMASQTQSVRTFFERYLERHNEKHACVNKQEDCWDYGSPRKYIAYHLKDKIVNIDGKLDEDAWKEVPWSEKFVDIRSKVYPKPYYDTKFKLRYDNVKLYIGAYVEEKNLWAVHEVHDSPLYNSNGFEVLMDVDGSMFNYKQLQINVLGTMTDILFHKSIWDTSFDNAANHQWNAQAERAVYPEGTINTPRDSDKYWSVEIAVPFQSLAEQSLRTQPNPLNNEVWFMQFGRSEYKLTVNNSQYIIAPNTSAAWWSWQQCDAINLHLQDRWGLVQFKRDLHDKKFRFDKWHIYKALFDMMDAMKKYKAINGFFPMRIEELDAPPYLLSRTCVDIPKIKRLRSVNGTDFEVTVKSMLISHAPAHIRSDRFVSFK